MILSRNKKNNVYPCKPQFYYIKVGFKGSTLYRHVFVMIHTVPSQANENRWSVLQLESDQSNVYSSLEKVCHHVNFLIISESLNSNVLLKGPEHKWRLRSACAASESSNGTLWVVRDPKRLQADREDSDQPMRVHIVVWIFTRRTFNLEKRCASAHIIAMWWTGEFLSQFGLILGLYLKSQ